jgi:membrane-associated phospholipid phosphatase
MRAALCAALAILALAASPRLATAQADLPAARAPVLDAAAARALSTSDGRRTNGEFANNLGRGAAGLYDRDNLGPFLIGAGATGAAMLFDDDCQRLFGVKRRAQRLGAVTDRLGNPFVFVPVAGALYGLGRLSDEHQHFRDWTYDITQATLITGAYTMAIKYATHRLRPDGSDHLSFPSGHTSIAFAWATVANRFGGPELGAPAFLLAGLVAVGRMEKNRHFLSDVVAGATLGYLVARTVIRENDDSPTAATIGNPLRPGPAPQGQPIVRVSFAF